MNIVDDDDLKWEKLYGDDGEVTRQYQREKEYRRGSSSGQQLINRREYDSDKAWSRAIKHLGNSFHSEVKPKKIQVKTVDGQIIDLDTYSDKKAVALSKVKDDNTLKELAKIQTLPSTLRVNGKQVSFSDGVLDETKIDIIKKFCRESEEREKFEDYLRRGNDSLIVRCPVLSLRKFDNGFDHVVTDTMRKEKFYDYIHDGYKLMIDNKPVGDKNMITVVEGCHGIVEGSGRTTVVGDNYVAKFYVGGIDDKIILSVHTHSTKRTEDVVKSVIADEKISDDIQAVKSMMCESPSFGKVDDPDEISEINSDIHGGDC